MKVYDVLGNEIATLVNETKPAGSYNYQFSTVNYQLSSGVYLYRLEIDGNIIDTKRMVLLK
ncbi:MAG: T9SS type A sorting domain-containing protein [Ignavibacteria bacterium]